MPENRRVIKNLLPDPGDWDDRYRAELGQANEPAPRDLLVQQSRFLPERGWALDIATGLGASAGYLRQRGLGVLAVDFSRVAIRSAKTRFPQVNFILGDADHLFLSPGRLNVITNFYYLNQQLWQNFSNLLQPGGLVYIECLTQEMRWMKPQIHSENLLQEGELKEAFTGWEILFYREGWFLSDHGHQKAVASLVARRP